MMRSDTPPLAGFASAMAAVVAENDRWFTCAREVAAAAARRPPDDGSRSSRAAVAAVAQRAGDGICERERGEDGEEETGESNS